MRKPLEMEVYMDHVDIERQRVKRPARVPRSIWMLIWEQFRPLEAKEVYCQHCNKRME
jgi:hypothetical protein